MSQPQKGIKKLLDFNSKKHRNNANENDGESSAAGEVECHRNKNNSQNLFEEPDHTPLADRATEILQPSKNFSLRFGKTYTTAGKL